MTTNITFPAGRLVQGSLYEAQTKDASGAPLVHKRGPNAGQPKVTYFFAVAIPKNGSADWKTTDWGRSIVAEVMQAAPQLMQHPKFAWKVIDGDSQVPDEKMRTPASREGYPGNWIVRFSSGYAPKGDGRLPTRRFSRRRP